MTATADNLCTFLDWDTNFFGYRIARVNSNTLTESDAKAVDKWSLDNAIDCLYFLARSDDMNTVRIAENHDYRHVDVRIVYEQKLNNLVEKSNINSAYELDVATVSDIPDILTMMNNSFIHSRFYYDPNFSEEQCNELYKTWLIRSIEDDLADRVFVMRKDEKAQAFLSCKLDTDLSIGTMGLMSVAPSARGQNLSTRLTQSALNYFKQSNIKTGQVTTQLRNIIANRLYQKCGFRLLEASLWYHKWYKE